MTRDMIQVRAIEKIKPIKITKTFRYLEKAAKYKY